MADHQNKLGSRLSIADLNDLEYVLDHMLYFESSLLSDEASLRFALLRSLFKQLRKEGERGGYDEWIIQEILP